MYKYLVFFKDYSTWILFNFIPLTTFILVPYPPGREKEGVFTSELLVCSYFNGNTLETLSLLSDVVSSPCVFVPFSR